MIESRYKIEYVLPETEQQTSKKFYFLSSLFLIPLVLVIAGAVAYGLGYKELPNDALELLTTLKNKVSSETILTEAEHNIPESETLPLTFVETSIITETLASGDADMNVPSI